MATDQAKFSIIKMIEKQNRWISPNRKIFYGIDPAKNAEKYKERLEYLDILLGAVPCMGTIHYPAYKKLRSIYLVLLKLEGELPIIHSLVVTGRIPLEQLEAKVRKIELLTQMRDRVIEQLRFSGIR